MFSKILFTVCLFAMSTTIMVAETITGRVTEIASGDSFKMTVSDASLVLVKLHAVMAPKPLQAFNLDAEAQLTALVLNKDVSLDVVATERGGVKVCRVTQGTLNISEEMGKTGLVWFYARYITAATDRPIIVAIYTAKAARTGLWIDATPIAPWLFGL